MGGVCCKNSPNSSGYSMLLKGLKLSINTDNIPFLEKILRKMNSLNIDVNSDIIEVNSNLIKVLTYAFIQGKIKSFKFLYKNGASIKGLLEDFEKLDLDDLEFLCDNNHVDLLTYYLPIYMINFQKCENSAESKSTLLFESELKKPKKKSSNLTPIQKACVKGNVQIVLTIFNYFKDSSNIPQIFDIEYPSELKGETCALIACRKGNYLLMKALHKICKADFLKKNNYGENALIICLTAYRRAHSSNFIECIYYLIEKIGIDLSYNYEDVLLLAHTNDIVNYLEKKLWTIGIQITKKEIEIKNKIVTKNSVDQDSEEEFESKLLKSEHVAKYRFSSHLSSILMRESNIESNGSFE